MDAALLSPCTAFDGGRRLAAGPLVEVALAVKAAGESGAGGPLLVFEDASGRVVDLDLRGTKAEVLARLSASAARRAPQPPAPEPVPDAEPEAPAAPRGRGRPKLGVVAREVTLLPRHWEWLSAQPGGASVALRKLVEAARRASGETDRARTARDAAYRVMAALAGDLPGFEEASRALFADDRERLLRHAAPWPADVRAYVDALAFPAAPDLPPGG
jgi:hypothetical protein